jgi:Tol biopolymer transport system component/regulator of sirC expression with transglutaminase-like and TPR domain
MSKSIIYSIVLILFLTACGGGESDTLTYRVEGSADTVEIVYSDADGNSTEDSVSLPWETTFEIGKEFNFKIVASNQQPTGDVACFVIFNDRELGDSHSDAYIECSGSVARSGNSTSSDFHSFPVESYLADAQEFYDQEDYQKALQEIDSALEVAPNFPAAYFSQGLVYKAMGESEKAISAYSQAIGLDPEFVKAYNNRGLLYQDRGDLDLAIEDWTTAVGVDPTYANGYFNRAIAYADMGELDIAREDVLKVQDLSDDPEMVAWAEEALAELDIALQPTAMPTMPPEPTPTEIIQPTDVPVAPSIPAAESRIAFTSDRSGDMEIYVMNVDGTDFHQLTDSPGIDINPVWSPDGTQIAFMSERDGNREIYVMASDGSNLTRLTDNPAADNSPYWSPNGQMIAFLSERSGNGDVFIMNADGSNIDQVTTDQSNDWAPVWNPETPELAFISDRDGDPEIYIISSDSGIRQLTDNDYYDQDVDWSPNGRFLAFASSPVANNPDIYIIRPDGSDLQQLTDNPEYDMEPTWSPDSNYLLFTSGRDGNLEIYLMEESGKIYRLTNDPGMDFTPSWGPMSSP